MLLKIYLKLLCFILLFTACTKRQTPENLKISGSVSHNGNPIAARLIIHKKSNSWAGQSGTLQIPEITTTANGSFSFTDSDFDNRVYKITAIPLAANIPIAESFTFNCKNKFTNTINIQPKLLLVAVFVKPNDTIKNLLITNSLTSFLNDFTTTEITKFEKQADIKNKITVATPGTLTTNFNTTYSQVASYKLFNVMYNKNGKDTSFSTQTGTDSLVLNL